MKNNFTAIHKIAFPLSFVLLVSPSISSQVAFAADSVSVDAAGGLELSITANRYLQDTGNTLAPVSVITRDDIEQIQAQDIIDVLRLQAGVDISRNGGAGSVSSVFLRGAESDQILVLIDGMRVSSVTAGSFDWSSLPLDQVERIEIVRGSRTSLYGSDAVGGVIQVFTRKGDHGNNGYGSVSFGRYGTVRNAIGFAEAGRKTKFSLNLSIEETDGFSASNEKAGAFVFNPDDDGHKKQSVSAAVSHQLTDKVTTGFTVFSSNNKVDYDQGNSDTDVETLQAFFAVKSSDRWQQKFTIGQSKNELLSRSSFGASTFDTSRKTFNWQNDLKVSKRSNLILGLDYRQDKGFTNSYADKISNKAAYAALNSSMGAFKLDLSGRYDKHSEAGNKFTGQIAGGYNLSPSTTAYASVGTGFRAPSINDLYSPGFVNFAGVTTYAGNPNLTPETSKNYEVGFKSKLAANHRLEANVFRTEIEDMVSFTGANNLAINSDEVTLKGIELNYKGRANKLDWALGATIQRANDISNAQRLVRRPNNKFTANLSYAMTNKTRFGLDLASVSSREDNDFSTFPAVRTSLDAYNLVNLSVQHKFNKHVAVGLRLENVTDEDYQLAQGFNTPGRGAYISLNLK